jgi:hypothetical protein
LGDFLSDAKSYGQLYFRGDSHPTWVGAYLIYRHIVETLSTAKVIHNQAISLSQLQPVMAQYQGDLFTQTNTKLAAHFQKYWGFMSGAHGLDVLVSLILPGSARKAQKVSVPVEYRDWFRSRETLVYENTDRTLPRAVVFRDSTFQFVCDLLAQHFSRSVFVWHQGQVIRDIIEREKPEVVIHGMAERFVTRYPKFVPLVRARAGGPANSTEE